MWHANNDDLSLRGKKSLRYEWQRRDGMIHWTRDGMILNAGRNAETDVLIFNNLIGKMEYDS